jgi:hypothetical protein
MSNRIDNIPYYPFIHVLIFCTTLDNTLTPYYLKHTGNEIYDLKHQ